MKKELFSGWLKALEIFLCQTRYILSGEGYVGFTCKVFCLFFVVITMGINLT